MQRASGFSLWPPWGEGQPGRHGDRRREGHQHWHCGRQLGSCAPLASTSPRPRSFGSLNSWVLETYQHPRATSMSSFSLLVSSETQHADAAGCLGFFKYDYKHFPCWPSPEVVSDNPTWRRQSWQPCGTHPIPHPPHFLECYPALCSPRAPSWSDRCWAGGGAGIRSTMPGILGSPEGLQEPGPGVACVVCRPQVCDLGESVFRLSLTSGLG